MMATMTVMTMNTADIGATPAASASSAQPARRRPATPCGLPHLTTELLNVHSVSPEEPFVMFGFWIWVFSVEGFGLPVVDT